MAAVKIVGDDKVYLEWLKEHPNGYVINSYKHMHPGYLVLHRGKCRSISGYKGREKPGGFTERQFIKICANSIKELRVWLKENLGTKADFSGHRCRCDAFRDEQS